MENNFLANVMQFIQRCSSRCDEIKVVFMSKHDKNALPCDILILQTEFFFTDYFWPFNFIDHRVLLLLHILTVWQFGFLSGDSIR